MIPVRGLVMRPRPGKRIWWPGAVLYCPGLIAVAAAPDAALTSSLPELQDNSLYKYGKLAFIVYFLPKKHDWIERGEPDAREGPV